MAAARTNRLAGETSPYLLQHARNPVDWFPWGAEALAKAEAEDKPILLSIGYAACHWCHVMERESFEDEATAFLMNEHFVSIKVDREERPDLDSVYMDAVQAMTGGGGWPLTAFLTPDGRPFYAGTYFPPEPRHGLPAFGQVLTGVAEAWRDRREELLAQGSRVTEAIARAGRGDGFSEPPSEATAREALSRLEAAFDERWGGFGSAPKFPQPATLEFVLRRAIRGDARALAIVTTTLDRLADGGIRDQVGGGFARYATDRAWHVPHFEKMLPDNAQLARLYVHTWLVTGEDRYRSVAVETLDYLLREMRHPGGGFFSSQDADADGVEGSFFTWTWEELVALVGVRVATAFGATPEGNWEGTNVLWRPIPIAEVAAAQEMSAADLEREVDGARAILLEARERRVRPAVDDKILTAWNALAISALVEAGDAFGELRYLEAAERCAAFLLDHLRDPSGRLLRSWRDGVAGTPAFADDHALLADACLLLYQRSGKLRWFREARRLADELLRLFRDEDGGGFFTLGSDAEALVLRPKELYDHAVPSGNSVAADVLQRLALLTGESGYERAAASCFRPIGDAIAQAPAGFGHALCALDLSLGPSREVAIVGDPGSAETRALVEEVTTARFRPNVVLAVAAPGDLEAEREVALLRDRPPVDGRATSYVCERFVCRLPVTEPEALRAALDDRA
jgi:uncharacterized protein YyaL (SSP411 family)